VSELLERIRREIHERLQASRAAVREHERLEAAPHALSAGSRATHAVTGRGTRAPAIAKAHERLMFLLPIPVDECLPMIVTSAEETSYSESREGRDDQEVSSPGSLTSGARRD